MSKIFDQCKECRAMFFDANKHWCPGKVGSCNTPWQKIIIPLPCCLMQSGYIWQCMECKVMFGDPNKHWNKFHCKHQREETFFEKMFAEEKEAQIKELEIMNKRIKVRHDYLVKIHKLFCAKNCEFYVKPSVPLYFDKFGDFLDKNNF